MYTDKEKRARKHSMYSCSCSSSTAVYSRRSWRTLPFYGFGCAATRSLLLPSPHLFFFHLYSLRLLSVPPSLLIAVQILHKQSIAAETFLLDHKKSNATHVQRDHIKQTGKRSKRHNKTRTRLASPCQKETWTEIQIGIEGERDRVENGGRDAQRATCNTRVAQSSVKR
jgi:hypothetical protein